MLIAAGACSAASAREEHVLGYVVALDAMQEREEHAVIGVGQAVSVCELSVAGGSDGTDRGVGSRTRPADNGEGGEEVRGGVDETVNRRRAWGAGTRRCGGASGGLGGG